MDKLRSRPIEALILLLIGYYILIVLLFEPVNFNIKIDFVLSAVGVGVTFLFISFAFRKELEFVESKLFGLFITGEFESLNFQRKFISLVGISIPVMAVSSLIEYVLSTIFVKAGSVAIGFPLSIYSFSAHKIIVGNLIINIISIISIFLFIGYTLKKGIKRI